MGSMRRTFLFGLALVTCFCLYYNSKTTVGHTPSSSIDVQYGRVDNLFSKFSNRRLLSEEGGDDFVATQHGLFGGLAHLNPEYAALSFILVVAIIVALEHFFHEIHTMTHDTPFADMVSAIEKELMIVGFMALGFKVIISTTYIVTEDWLHPFEMADLIVPITSFMFCMQGFLLCIQSIKNVETWRKAYHLHLFEILDEYYDIYFDREFNEMPWYGKLDFNGYENNDPLKPYFSLWAGFLSFYELMIFQYQYNTHHNPCLQVIVRWIPYLSPRIYGEMEFRILHSAFCETFLIQHNAMPFDEYVRRVTEKEILNLITIDPGNWLMIIMLGLANTFRTVTFTGNEPPHCDKYLEEGDYGGGGDGAHRMLSAADVPAPYQECVDKESLVDFFVLGLCMLLLNIIIFGFARFYEFRIMRRFDVWSVAHYAPYLQKTETVSEHKRKEAGRLSASELRQVLVTAKEKILFHSHSGHHNGEFSCDVFALIRGIFKRRSVLDADASETGILPKIKRVLFGNARKDKAAESAGTPGLKKGLSGRALLKSPNARGVSSGPDSPERAPHVPLGANTSKTPVPDVASPINEFPGGSPMAPKTTHVAFGALVTESPGTEEKTLLTPEKDPELDQVPHHKKHKKHKKKGGVHDHEDSDADEHAKDDLKDNFLHQLTHDNDDQVLPETLARSLSLAGQPLEFVHRKMSTAIHKVLPGGDGGDIGGHGHGDGLYGNAGRMKGVFLWNKASYFFDCVDHMMMIISFYLSLWIVNYGTVAYRLPTEGVNYQLLTISPAIASTFVYLLTVRSTCLLKAVTVLDADIMETTLEDAETAKMLGLSVRRKILHKLHINKYGERTDKPHPGHKDHHMSDEDVKHCEDELRALFDSIDTDDSGLLSRAEFKFFLGELHISFSHKRWRQIFRYVHICVAIFLAMTNS